MSARWKRNTVVATMVLLVCAAVAHTPTLLYFGAQPGAEAFYEKNGCQRSLPSYLIEPKKDGAS